MGMLGKATRVARGTVRAGSSIARGNVPSLGVRVGVGGFGVGVGTRGISLRTPVLGGSVGPSGFSTTLKVPGVASLSINPTRPAATVGFGPFKIRASRHPGIGVRTGLISLGVTTKPLAWIDVIGVRIAIPGQLPQRERPWHEEVDDQWKPYYERRPPGVSEQVHDLIREVELGALAIASTPIATPVRPKAEQSVLNDQEIRNHQSVSRRAARQSVPVRRFKLRREARDAADEAHRQWIESELARREENRLSMQASIDRAFADWKDGAPLAVALVANALLAATGLPGFIVSAEENAFTVVVLAPALETVHPYEPSWSPQGAPTMKKRSKAVRSEVHTALVGATTVGVLRALTICLPKTAVIRVAVILLDGDLKEAPTVAWFEHDVGHWLPVSGDEFRYWMEDQKLKRVRPLSTFLPGAFDGEKSAPAVAIGVTSALDLSSPVFWIELDAVLDEFRHSRRSEQLDSVSAVRATKPDGSPKTRPRRPSTSRPTDIAATEDTHIWSLTNEQPEAREQRSKNEKWMELLRRYPGILVAADDTVSLESAVIRLTEIIPALVADEAPFAVTAINQLFNGIVGSGRPDLVAIIERVTLVGPLETQVQVMPTLDSLRLDIASADRILGFVEHNPGCRQANLGSELSLDQSLVRKICLAMANFGRLDREKWGNSYALKISGEHA